MSADKAKRTLLAIDIPRDELALRMLMGGMGIRPPAHMTVAEALADAERLNPGLADLMRRQADAAVLYFHERIQAGRQPN